MKKNKEKIPKKKFKRVNMRKVFIISGWSIMALAVGVGFYNGLTKVDTVTHEKVEVVKEKNIDNSGINSFVQNFSTVYFSYANTTEAKAQRQEKLSHYFTEDLHRINSTNLTDITDTSTLESVQVWNIEPKTDEKDNKIFQVYFIVKQKVKDKLTETAYNMDVYKNKDSFLVVKNPSVASLPKVAKFKVEKPSTNHDLKDLNELNKIEDFLNTFFKLYPTASKKEIVYYVKDNSIDEINKNYEFVEIQQLTISKEGGGYSAHFFVVYKDKDTKMTLLNEYHAIVEKDPNSKNYIILELN